MCGDCAVMGIDLGTLYTKVAILINGEPVICNHERGLNATPSIVSFDGTVIYVGEEAKDRMTLNQSNTITEVKRNIGKKFNKDMLNSQIKIIPNSKDDQSILFEINTIDINQNQKIIKKYPEEICAQLFLKMSEYASTWAGKEIKKAVITVPAYFGNEQRLAIKRSGDIAGLNVIGIINEPTAALFAYGASCAKDKHVMIIDIGDTFDVTIMKCDGSSGEIISSSGDTMIGGSYIDQTIVDMVIEDLIKKELIEDQNDISNEQMALLRLKAEEAKISLQTSFHETIEIPKFKNGYDYKKRLSRTKLLSDLEEVFDRILSIIHDCFEKSGILPDDINEVLFTGGSSNIQELKDKVMEIFPNSEICLGLSPQDVNAKGAVLYAANLCGPVDPIDTVKESPTAIGVEVAGGKLSIVLPKGSPINQSFKKKFYTPKKNMKSIRFYIFEGDDEDIRNDSKYGKNEVEIDIPPGTPKGFPIEISTEIDVFGFLVFKAIIGGNVVNKHMTNEPPHIS